jgi:hypothetical protein
MAASRALAEPWAPFPSIRLRRRKGVDRRSTARVNLAVINCLESFSVRPVDHLAGSAKSPPLALAELARRRFGW